MRLLKVYIFGLLLIFSSIYRCQDESDGEVVEDTPENLEGETQEQYVDNGVVKELTEEDLKNLQGKGEKHEFQAEVNRMMEIIINSLYKTKEIFLRELLSNSYDAIDKIRLYAVQNTSALDSNPDLKIWIKIDPVNRTITVQDSGIGMTKQEMITNLGTIAKSGTKDFIKKISEMNANGDKVAGDISSQIGQFGVGLYSIFLVADKVIIASKSNDDPEQHIWEADSSSFSVYTDSRGDTLKRGTSVTIYLNADSGDFLQENKILELINKYSEFVDFPIYLWSKMDADKKEVPYHWRHVNDVKPIWMRPPSEVTEEQYTRFFNYIYYGNDKDQYSKPSLTIHFSAEGEIRFTALVFIPDKLPKKYVDSQLTWKMLLRLYVRRVFITSDTHAYLPHFLRFVGGIIDSDGLPLNVGRESLQHRQLESIVGNKLVRKILDGIKKKASGDHEEYTKFYQEFGNAIKFGILDDQSNANRIARLIRFHTSYSPDNYTSFDDYISRMKPGQSAIYYLTASSVQDAKRSPYLERLTRKGYEVIFFVDNIDETVMQNLMSYDNKAIQHIGKEGHEVSKTKSEESLIKEKEEEFKPLIKWLNKYYKSRRVGQIRVSTRMLSSSCILIASDHGYSGNMDRIIRSQAYVHGKESGFDEVLNQPKNLEINPFHPLSKIMFEAFKNDPEGAELKDSAETCISVATMAGGYTIDDRVSFASFIEKLYLKNHNVDYDKISETIHKELDMDDDYDDDEKKDSDDNESEDDKKDSDEDSDEKHQESKEDL